MHNYKPVLCLIFSLFVTSPGFTAESVANVLASPGRPEADLARDARSRPDAILPLLQLQPGDRIADIWAGGGYYSELFARLVGPQGEVLVLNNAAYQQFAGDQLAPRMSDPSTSAMKLHIREADNLDLGIQTLDAAAIIMSYHDLYHVDEPNGWNPIDADQFLDQIVTALKPGGRFLIVDHFALPGSGKEDAQDLHRIDIEFAKSDIQSHGLVLSKESEVLRNPNDDYSLSVFDAAVRGKTDRFALVFTKP